MTTSSTPETTTDPDRIAPVLPEGRDPLDDLTVGELGTVGRLLKYDPATAVRDPSVGLRWPALAHLAWVWAKRSNPHAKLDPFLQLTAEQIGQALRMDEPEPPTSEAGDGSVEENPTDSTPA